MFMISPRNQYKSQHVAYLSSKLWFFRVQTLWLQNNSDLKVNKKIRKQPSLAKIWDQVNYNWIDQLFANKLVNIRVIYDRVWNRKNYFEIPAFLPIERGISRAGKFKVMLHFEAADEMCLFVFLFSFEFPTLEVPCSKFKKVAISK